MGVVSSFRGEGIRSDKQRVEHNNLELRFFVARETHDEENRACDPRKTAAENWDLDHSPLYFLLRISSQSVDVPQYTCIAVLGKPAQIHIGCVLQTPSSLTPLDAT